MKLFLKNTSMNDLQLIRTLIEHGLIQLIEDRTIDAQCTVLQYQYTRSELINGYT